MLKLLFLATLLVALVGCVGPKIMTPSGKVERIVRAPADKVRIALVNEMLNNKFNIKSETQFMMTFERNAGFVTDIFFSVAGGPRARHRIKSVIVPVDGGIRVSGDLYLVSEDFQGEREDELDNQAEVDWLDAVIHSVKIKAEQSAVAAPVPAP